MSKILHVSDSHLDERLDLEHNFGLHLEIGQVAQEKKVDLIVHTGDLFNRRSSIDARNAAARILGNWASVAPVVLVRGNHDIPGDLQIFGSLAAKHRIIVCERIHRIKFSSLGLEIHALPWIDKANLAPIFQLLGVSGQMKRSDAVVVDQVRQMLNVFRAWAAEAKEAGRQVVGAAHAMIGGSTVSTGQTLIGEGIEFSSSDFADTGAVAWLLGHIHMRQSWQDSRVSNAGSPERLNFGEDEEKSVQILSVHEDGIGWERIPTNARKLAKREYTMDSVRSLLAGEGDDFTQDLEGAYVRVRVKGRKDELRTLDKDALEAVFLRFAGASSVKIEKIPELEARVRSEEIVDATTLWDQTAAYLESRDVELEADPRRQLEAAINETELAYAQEHGPTAASLGLSRPLLLSRAAVKGINGVDVDLDLEGLGEGLVALVGHNGAGKTTWVESVPGALYGHFPSRKERKPIHAFAKGEASIGLLFHDMLDGPSPIEVNVAIDGPRRKAEGYLVVDGEPRGSGKISDLRPRVQEIFGSYESLLSSVFAAQSKKGSFRKASRADRKKLFAEYLGLERFSWFSEFAGKRHKAASDNLADQRRDLKTVSIDLEDLAQVDDRLQKIDAEISATDDAILRHEKEVGVLRSAIADQDKLRIGQGELQRIFEGSSEELVQQARETVRARNKLGEAQAPVEAETQEVVEPEDAKRAAREKAEKAIDALKKEDAAANVILQEKGLVLAAPAELEKVEAYLSKAREKLNFINDAKRENDLREAEHDRDQALAKLDADEQLAGKLEGARCGALEWIPVAAGDDTPVDLLDECVFPAAAREAADRLDGHREAIAGAEKKVAAEQEKKEQRDALKKELANAIAALDKDRIRLDRLAGKKPIILLAQEQVDGFARKLDGINAARENRIQEIDDSFAQVREAGAELDRLRAEKIETAQALLDRCTEKEAEAANKKEAAYNKVRAYLEKHAEELQADYRARLSDEEQHLKTARAGLTKLATVRGTLKEQAARREQLEKRKASIAEAIAELEARVQTWGLVVEAVGLNGIPALLIDAAGPEVSDLVNALLESCYSARFSIEIQTSRPKVKTKGFVEDFRILVYDDGEERDLEDLSGGEGAIVDEALALGLAIFNAQKSGIRWLTLFRDETMGPLDEESRIPYVQMIRKARQIGGFFQIVFVAHVREVWEAADHRIHFAGGRARFESIA